MFDCCVLCDSYRSAASARGDYCSLMLGVVCAVCRARAGDSGRRCQSNAALNPLMRVQFIFGLVIAVAWARRGGG